MTDAHAARLEKDGFTIVRGALDATHVKTLLADIDRLEVELAISHGENIFEGFKTKRVYNLLARGESFVRAVDHDVLVPVLEGLLGRGLLVGTVSSIAIEPGETPQPMHADDQIIPLDRPHPALTSTVMIALTPFDATTGGTRIVAGSHTRPSFPEPFGQYPDAKNVELEPGDALIYNGSLWHGGGENRSTGRRVGLAIGYCAGWLRQQENQQLGIPKEIAKTFSPRLRKLVGYGLYKTLYGHIDRCSPVDLLDDAGRRVVVGVPR